MISPEYNPPISGQSSTVGSASLSSPQGQNLSRLLGLVRMLEKDADMYEERVGETVDTMNELIALYSRRGLLQGDSTKAEHILSTAKNSTSDKSSKRALASGANLRLDPGQEDGVSSETSGAQQETLLFTAILRILNGPNEDSRQGPLTEEDRGLLSALAAEICVAITGYTMACKVSSKCVRAEHEMLTQFGKQILSGLLATIQRFQSDICSQSLATAPASVPKRAFKKCMALAYVDDDIHVQPIISCLKAASSLVALFGTKLSRSTALLSQWKAAAWQLITIPNHSVQHASARLLACLSLAGGIDRKTPSDVWNSTIADVLSMSTTLRNEMVPLSKKSGNAMQRTLSEQSGKVLQDWISFVREDISSESARVKSFLLFQRALTMCFQVLLSQDWQRQNENRFLDGKVEVAVILDAVEGLLSFPLSAEAVFKKTKKRLRDEAIEGGLISPRAIVTSIANEVKANGHSILDCLLASLGGPVLAPYARRIIRMTYASLLISCSGPVRRVTNPSSPALWESKKRGWLYMSVAMRARSIQTVGNVLLAFGSDTTAKASTSDRKLASSSDGEMAIVLVAGCMLELVAKTDVDEAIAETWGSLRERMELVIACVDCLTASLSSCGGFLHESTRSLIDSTVLACLTNLESAGPEEMLGLVPVKARVFRIASTCVSTPWGDGSSTAILSTLVDVALKSEANADPTVSMAARDALRTCDLARVPRAPALVYVTRGTSSDDAVSRQMDVSASDVVTDIKKVTVEAAEAKKRAEVAQQAKAEEKRRREAEREQAQIAKKQKLEKKERPSFDVKSQQKNATAEDTAMDNPTPREGDNSRTTDDQLNNEGDNAQEEHPMEADEPSTKGDAAVEKPTERDNAVALPSREEKEADEADESDDDDLPDILGGEPDSEDE